MTSSTLSSVHCARFAGKRQSTRIASRDKLVNLADRSVIRASLILIPCHGVRGTGTSCLIKLIRLILCRYRFSAIGIFMHLSSNSFTPLNGQWGSPSASDPRAKNTGQRATKGTVLTSQSLSPWCDCRRLDSTWASWRWQGINVGNPLWRRALLFRLSFISNNEERASAVTDVLSHNHPNHCDSDDIERHGT